MKVATREARKRCKHRFYDGSRKPWHGTGKGHALCLYTCSAHRCMERLCPLLDAQRAANEKEDER